MSTPFSHFLQNINQISPLEHEFTEVLEGIALKPKILYFYGKLPEIMSKKLADVYSEPPKIGSNLHHISASKSSINRPKAVAIVGSRHNTVYGQEIAHKMAYSLAQKGVVVISGLAYGIDSIAHRGALDANGVTVAVLGNPLDHIHPCSHTALAREIITQNGAIISEYPPYTPEFSEAPLAPGERISESGQRQLVHKVSFLYRNRIISGLSDIVVVVEAAERSGSLNTATHALAQGKTVFAVPGNVNSPYSQGCNKLIRQGALPYTCPDDILSLLFPEDYIAKHRRLRQANLFGDNDVETFILQELAKGNRSGEEIMQNTHLPPEVFNEAVTILEVKGRLRSLGMNLWSLS